MNLHELRAFIACAWLGGFGFLGLAQVIESQRQLFPAQSALSASIDNTRGFASLLTAERANRRSGSVSMPKAEGEAKSACCSSSAAKSVRTGFAVMGSTQSWHSAPQSLKSLSRRSDAGSIPATSTIRGGALVSTGVEGSMETAEPRSRETAQNNNRQHSVEDGGLTAPRDAGSLGQSNQQLRSLANSAAHVCGVPERLFARLIARESSWNPLALSSSGAVGLAQVKPSTARGISQTLDVNKPFDNLLLGACYLRQMRDRFGSWSKALHAYHGGPTRVDARLTTQASRLYAAGILEGTN